MLAERRAGYVIILVLSLLGSGIPVMWMTGMGVGGDIAKSSGAFFFVWTLIALGVTTLFSVILSARALWTSTISTTWPLLPQVVVQIAGDPLALDLLRLDDAAEQFFDLPFGGAPLFDFRQQLGAHPLQSTCALFHPLL